MLQLDFGEKGWFSAAPIPCIAQQPEVQSRTAERLHISQHLSLEEKLMINIASMHQILSEEQS